MQGSYKNNGLPRPYYMKPSKSKKLSPYDNLPNNFFKSPRRKIVGYFIMLFLFCLSVYSLGQSLRARPVLDFELEDKQDILSKEDILEPNLGANIDVSGPEKDESGNIGLAGNMAAGSNGDVGLGVQEAPKGGIANEAPMVGNDEEAIMKGKKKAADTEAENAGEVLI